MNEQEAIEVKLTNPHFHNGDIIFYNLSLNYIEGSHYPLRYFRYLRTKKRGKR